MDSDVHERGVAEAAAEGVSVSAWMTAAARRALLVPRQATFVRFEIARSAVAPLTTAPVVAQASRSRRQVQLRRLLRGCEVVGLGPAEAHEVDSLVGRAGTSDVVDAHLVVTGA